HGRRGLGAHARAHATVGRSLDGLVKPQGPAPVGLVPEGVEAEDVLSFGELDLLVPIVVVLLVVVLLVVAVPRTRGELVSVAAGGRIGESTVGGATNRPNQRDGEGNLAHRRTSYASSDRSGRTRQSPKLSQGHNGETFCHLGTPTERGAVSVNARKHIADLVGPLEDAELVRRIRAGETGLFELVMRRYNQRLFRVLRALLRDEAEAEDVLQDAYVRAYEHLDQLQQPERLSSWLTHIAVHEAKARLRRAGRIADVKKGPLQLVPSPSSD